MKKEKKKEKARFNKRTRRVLNLLLWVGAFAPLFVIVSFVMGVGEDELPSVADLENPPELLASVVLADDGKSELGRYWSVNRTTVEYKNISPYVTDALIATEDERFLEHSGIDFRALARAVKAMGSDGGASTISQQLAKLLFTLKERKREAELRAQGREDEIKTKSGKVHRLREKIKENIIAVRLEKRYTKEEIITMYLNQFDFLYNAVGVENAAKVYFNKKPIDLTKEEAATLVGMAKNPGLYSPYKYQIKDYRSWIANRKNVSAKSVTQAEVNAAREKDSLRAINRRNTVLNQWRKSSKSENSALKNLLSAEECDSLKKLPIVVTYQVVDHKQGIAPYFREELRKDLKALFSETDDDGKFKYAKKDGSKYNIYADGLKIYTTINVNMQKHGEYALKRHLKEDLQPQFTKNNMRSKHFPFANRYNGKTVSDQSVENAMNSGRKSSNRYIGMMNAGVPKGKVLASFEIPVPMRIFSWSGDIDTVMTPNDSIRYYKNFLHAGLISIDPATGFVKAWVGGANFNHFALDHGSNTQRQVGSTMKPFVYSTAISLGAVQPCTDLTDAPTSVAPCDPSGKIWSPAGKLIKNPTVANCLAASNNPGTVAVMSKMGACSGPHAIAQILERMDIVIPQNQIVPPICLGTPDISLLKMVGAQSMFVNNGIFVRPSIIMRIEDRNGNIIYSADVHAVEVMNPGIAYETLKMMKGVVTHGTSTSLRSTRKWGGISHPTAGKTGTTQSNTDGWFMGLTPDLVTGVWVGAENPIIHFRSMQWGQGARMALPIYGYYMQKVYDDKELKVSTKDFEAPVGHNPELFNCNGDNDAWADDQGNDLGI